MEMIVWLAWDRESLYTVTRDAGEAISFFVADGQVSANLPGARPVPATHSTRNVGTSTFREVLIEFKG